MRLWAEAPAMGELSKVIDWQERQLEKLGVKILTNRDVTVEEIVNLGVDTTIVATGSFPLEPDSRPWVSKLPGAADSELAIVTPHEVLENNIQTATKAIVWDQAGEIAGSQSALSAAESIVQTGAEVEVITPNSAVGEDIPLTTRTPLYERLLSAGTIFTPNSEVSAIGSSGVIIRNIYSGEERQIPRVDLLVSWLGNQAQYTLWNDLRGLLKEVHAIGDCVAPRSVEVATLEGAKIARIL